jgi:hypothetical protein
MRAADDAATAPLKEKKASGPAGWGKKTHVPANAAAPATTPAATCDPPFVVDSNGIEHFKPNCL